MYENKTMIWKEKDIEDKNGTDGRHWSNNWKNQKAVIRKEVNTAINKSTMRCYGHKYKLKKDDKESV